MDLLDPTNDYVFKVLFKDPEAERRLISMLTAVLEPTVPIVSAKVLNPELPADLATGKAIVLDLLVRLADGRTVDVEAESSPTSEFIPRYVFYWARNHAQQLAKGEDYGALRPTISIAWIRSSLVRASRGAVSADRMHSRFRIRNVESGADLTDHLELHLLELPELGRDGTLSPSLRRWARFFDRPTDAELTELAAEDDVMGETVDKLRAVSDDEVHQRLAEARFRGEVKERLARGAARDEGREEGRRELARAMLLRGLDRAVVADALGVEVDDLDAFLAGD